MSVILSAFGYKPFDLEVNIHGLAEDISELSDLMKELVMFKSNVVGPWETIMEIWAGIVSFVIALLLMSSISKWRKSKVIESPTENDELKALQEEKRVMAEKNEKLDADQNDVDKLKENLIVEVDKPLTVQKQIEFIVRIKDKSEPDQIEKDISKEIPIVKEEQLKSEIQEKQVLVEKMEQMQTVKEITIATEEKQKTELNEKRVIDEKTEKLGRVATDKDNSKEIQVGIEEERKAVIKENQVIDKECGNLGAEVQIVRDCSKKVPIVIEESKTERKQEKLESDPISILPGEDSSSTLLPTLDNETESNSQKAIQMIPT